MEAVASPCINVCRLDPGGHWCLGCGRSIEEIAAWSAATDAEKQAIVHRAARRREEMPAFEAGPGGVIPDS